MDRIGPDPLGGVLDGRGFGKQPHCSLGCVVGGGQLAAYKTGNRRDVHNRATSGISHGRNSGLGAQEHSLGVDAHDLVPFISRSVFHVVGPVYAGVVDQDIQLSVAGYGFVDRPFPGIFVTYIQAYENALTASLVYLGFYLAALVFKHVSDDYFGALFGEELGFNRAHPTGPTADQGDLILQSHGVCSLSCRNVAIGRSNPRRLPTLLR